MKDYYSKNLVKSNPKSKNLERYNKFKFDAKLKHPKNIFFKIKIGNTNDTHRLIFKLYDSIVPLTSKNFRILASDGVRGKSYKNSIFHRVIKGFMIQGGDIVNSDGTGSISIYGNKFEDENFKVKHDKAGLLSMANSGPNTNGSQFFITTAPAKHLDDKHVVFGELIGGLESVRLIESVDTDDNDRPYEEIKIVECGEIVSRDHGVADNSRAPFVHLPR